MDRMSFIMLAIIVLFGMVIDVNSLHAQSKNEYIPETGVSNINVVFIWFDDLAFSDVGYNGADFPTPILDDLANKDAIKMNFHYTEQVCSASRSSFLTGRYSWLSGLNSISAAYTNAGFDPTLTLFPELLDQNDYNTYIAGKWHIGYHSTSVLPFKNGFKSGLYSHMGLQYYQRHFSQAMQTLDSYFGEPSFKVKKVRRQLPTNFRTLLHDTYRIDHYQEEPAFIEDGLSEDPSYNEDLYTEDIKSYIAAQNGINPFFVYYSQWTPHDTLAQPPDVRPDGSLVDYSACYAAFPDRSEPECDLDADTRCVFCKQIHYASVNIKEIIHELKTNENLNWDETVVIITSDNGAHTGIDGGYAFGSALPLRGQKTGTHEGGIRTPAIIKGGYIENLLKQNVALKDNVCEYDEMVHVSDWYDIITNGFAGIDDYEPDSDHSDIDVWGNMRCQCTGKNPGYCNQMFPPRDELIQMRMCGNGDYAKGEKFFYSAYVRQGDWKLVVNGSNHVLQTCENFEVVDPDDAFLFNYIEADGVSLHPVPDEDYYNNHYIAAQERLTPELAKKLYGSECLEQYATESLNSLDLSKDAKFIQSSELLYEIPRDRVEACAIQNNDAKKKELLDYLIKRSEEYVVQQDPYEQSMGAFAAQMSSFDCSGVTLTKPWNGVEYGDIDAIWTHFTAKYIDCFGLEGDSYDYSQDQDFVDDDVSDKKDLSIENELNVDNVNLKLLNNGQFENVYWYIIFSVILLALFCTFRGCMRIISSTRDNSKLISSLETGNYGSV